MAESIVVADNVELVVNNIQSKVGATLLGTKALAEDTVQGSGPTSNVLEKIKDLQSKTVEKITAVWEILRSQLDLEKEAERKKAEQAKEIALEGQRKKKKITGGLEQAAEEESSGFNFKRVLATVGTTLLTVGGLRMFAGAIFKGGIWGLLGMAAGSALVNLFDVSNPSAVDAIKTTLPTAAAMLAMFKLKTALLVALPIVSAFGIASIASWLTGKKAAAEVTGFDWGTAALTGPALALFLKLGLGVKFGATLGGLVFGWPLIVAGSLAIALGVGASYLANKVDLVEDSMLEHLKETTEMTQDEFEKKLKEDRATKLANWSISLQAIFDKDALNMAQQNTLAFRVAGNEFKETGKLKPGTKTNIMDIIDKYTGLSDEGIQALLDDKHRLDDVNDLKIEVLKLAKSGALGDDKDNVMNKLALMEENIQEGAIKKMAELSSKGLKVEAHISQTADATSGGKYGSKANLFEKFMTNIEPHYRPRLEAIKKLEEDPEYIKLKEAYFKDRQGMSQKDEDDYLAREQKIKDLKGVQNIGRTGEIPLHMMSAAGQVGMMEWLMSKDEGERIKLNKKSVQILSCIIIRSCVFNNFIYSDFFCLGTLYALTS